MRPRLSGRSSIRSKYVVTRVKSTYQNAHLVPQPGSRAAREIRSREVDFTRNKAFI